MRRTLATTAAILLLSTAAACSSSDHPQPVKARTATSAAPGGAPAKKPPTAEARKQAAAILKKEDADFRAFLTEGQDAVGTPDFTDWYQKAIVGLDMQQTAFQKADALFTAKNEPTALMEAWRTDNASANAAITQFATDGTAPDAPNSKTRKDASDALKALEKADKDAEQIANGG
ncbi:hypothetical protein ACIQ9J_01445 [Streptomyces sp. NPDC094153]|uniref:hypothetical protein n=1 Tax=Streptomyces sp. NPDC094153 TaxID=3366058 RepID=UPI0038147188